MQEKSNSEVETKLFQSLFPGKGEGIDRQLLE